MLQLAEFSQPDDDRAATSIVALLLSRLVVQRTVAARARRLLRLSAVAVAMVGLVAFVAGRRTDFESSAAGGRMGAIVNLPIETLVSSGAREGRSEELEIRLPVDAGYLALLLTPDQLDPFPHYRIRILDHRDREVWTGDGLRPGRFDSFSLGIPAALLPAGRYRLRLLGVGDREERLIDEFLVRLEYSAHED